MKYCQINITDQTVSMFNERINTWETASFYECGSEEEETDKEIIKETLEEREGKLSIEFI